MNNEKNRMDLNNSFRKTQKSVNKKKHTCLYPNCSNIAVSSHSQQRNRSLKSISRDNHVYTLNADLGHSYKFKNDEFNISFKLTGIGEVSTFNGFCNDHENLFEIFEQNGLDVHDQRAVSYLHYRTLMYGYSKIRREIERIEFDKEQSIKTFQNINTESILTEILQMRNIELINFKNQSDIVIQHIENDNKDFLSFLTVELSENIGVSSSGNSMLNNDNKNSPIFSFNILPDENSTIIIITWLRIYDNQAKWLVELFNKDLELLINLIAFYLTEDISISPDLWESNDEIEKVVISIEHLIDPLFFQENKIKRVLKLYNSTNI